MSTKSPRLPLLSLLALACILSTSGCKTVSTVRSEKLTVKPTAPQVRCKQQAAPGIHAAPRSDEWIESVPARPGASAEAARLSEKAVAWIVDTMGVVTKLRGLREVEHACLDEAEKKGLIRQ